MIDIHTDGSCIDNPGSGGWAAIIVEDGVTAKFHGREENTTTNNRMELLAAIKGLEAVPAGVDVRVHSDSQYLINTMTKGWKRNRNGDLWARLDAEVTARRVDWKWVRGHAGDPLNEDADRLANAEARGEFVGDPPASVPRRRLSHVDSSGRAQMVDVGAKVVTERTAVATGTVLMQPDTLRLIEDNAIEKGDVLGAARLAGIMAAKNTAQLIPLCHPLPLDQVMVEFHFDHGRDVVDIQATARTSAKTGVEMEAMTAVSVAALTIYDMCKAVDRAMRIGDIRLRRKSGGKSGDIVFE